MGVVLSVVLPLRERLGRLVVGRRRVARRRFLVRVAFGLLDVVDREAVRAAMLGVTVTRYTEADASGETVDMEEDEEANEALGSPPHCRDDGPPHERLQGSQIS